MYRLRAPLAASCETTSAGDPAICSTTPPMAFDKSRGRLLSTTTRLSPYAQVPKVSTFSKVLRPITIASTLAINSVYPCGSPPPSGKKSSSSFFRAMKPSTLVPIETEAVIDDSSPGVEAVLQPGQPAKRALRPSVEAPDFQSGEWRLQ